MKKIILMLIASVTMVFAATPEQVERYLMLSGSEDQLVQTEQMIDGLGQMLSAKTGHDVPLMQDSQMIPIRFRDYLQKHLSDSEMDEIIALYKNDVLRKLVTQQALMSQADTAEEYRQFRARIKNDPLPASRVDSVKNTIKNTMSDELLAIFFDKLMMPMIDQMSKAGGSATPLPSKDKIKKMKKSMIKNIRKSTVQTYLFMTRDFTDEEIDRLNELSGTSASNHENRAVMEATVTSIEEAMRNMAKAFGAMIRDHKHPKAAPSSKPASGESNTTRKPAGKSAA